MAAGLYDGCELPSHRKQEANLQPPEILKTVSGVVVSVGEGGAIVAGLSSWLRKLWTERFTAREKTRYDREMAALTARLSRDTDRTGQTLREKLALYKETIRPIVNLMTKYVELHNQFPLLFTSGKGEKLVRYHRASLDPIFSAPPDLIALTLSIR
jgi:hypothetical protein